MSFLRAILLTIFSCFTLATLIYGPSAAATELRHRLGVGMTGQLKNDIPALSLKLQKSANFAIGAMLGIKTNPDQGGFGAGLKFYRILFDEPLLNFYSALTVAIINSKEKLESHSGFQVDGTFGSEFQFPGLQSLGFSFEFGISVNKVKDDLSLESLGDHIVKSAIHFYI